MVSRIGILKHLLYSFYPTALKDCQGIVFTCSVLLGTLVVGYRCAMSWCDLDLTFDLAIVTLSLKITGTVRCRKLVLGRDIGWRL